jgi:hypothetical protein
MLTEGSYEDSLCFCAIILRLGLQLLTRMGQSPDEVFTILFYYHMIPHIPPRSFIFKNLFQQAVQVSGVTQLS